MELFRGHFYNWYDTRDLRPLEPKYVSSVDSGNLAGHLLALGNSCRELMQKSSRRTAHSCRIARYDSPVARSACQHRRHAAHADRHAETTQQRRRRDDGLARLRSRWIPWIGRCVSRSGELTPRPWLTSRKLWRRSRETLPNPNCASGPTRSGPASKATSAMRKS